ncbi:hypothetical protein VSR01_16320 [Actinacidiphila sp. DG2A-62]|nr:hypothetical protein [Actinacidiphila sp. DG2A-62]MEC3995011.1 hypothetical protein [Actinacidiphila sp. DG2A-62]
MPLPSMPIRDNRPGDEPHAREYDPNTGGWTRPATAPAPAGREQQPARR